jgi:hypothetical protein
MALYLVLVFNTPSPLYQNFHFVLGQIDPASGPVRNAKSQNNWPIHFSSILSFKIIPDMECQSYVCLPVICLYALQWGCHVAVISLMKSNNNTDLVIGTHQSVNSTKITWSSNIQADSVSHALRILLLSLVPLIKFQWTTRVALANKPRCTDMVSVHPHLSNSSNLACSMAPALLKYDKAIILNKSSECE